MASNQTSTIRNRRLPPKSESGSCRKTILTNRRWKRRSSNRSMDPPARTDCLGKLQVRQSCSGRHCCQVVSLLTFSFVVATAQSRLMVLIIPTVPYSSVLSCCCSITFRWRYFCGRTLGKFITGTKVVSADGETPTASQIVGRTFCRMIPFEAFSFARETCPVGWHDKFSWHVAYATDAICFGRPIPNP